MIYVKVEQLSELEWQATAYENGKPTGSGRGSAREIAELVRDLTDLSAALAAARLSARIPGIRRRRERARSGQFAVDQTKLR